jgi:hypothetical protein
MTRGQMVRQRIDRIEAELEAAGVIPSREELAAIAERLMRAREEKLPKPSLLRRLLNLIKSK